MNGFSEKSIMVTGAGSGIGRASAEGFAAAGARVTVVDVDRTGGEATVEEIRRNGGIAQFVQADVSDEASVEAAVKKAVSAYGGLDGAHNNAGIDDVGAVIAEYDLADWQRILSVNLTGVFLCLKHELPALVERGGGAIVNTSSGLGKVGVPGHAGYCSTKAGIMGLTVAAAIEYVGHGIRVNAVLPGGIDTPFTEKYPTEVRELLSGLNPMKRFGTPQEVAAAAMWLCSDAAGFINGTLLPVDGGHLVSAGVHASSGGEEGR